MTDWERDLYRAAAGHDVASVFKSPSYKCVRCGAHQIDLSEDLAYGEMRKCFPHAGDDGWQDIATAPKDGTEFLAHHPNARRYFVACFVDDGRLHNLSCNRWGEATHWRPLPTPPAGVSDNG